MARPGGYSGARAVPTDLSVVGYFGKVLQALSRDAFHQIGITPHWFGALDNTGAYLSDGKTFKLTVPHPMPASLFWPVTVYNPDTRSEINSGQGKAALRSLFDIRLEITRLGNNPGSIDLSLARPRQRAKKASG